MKRRTTMLFVLAITIGIVSFTRVEKKSFVKGTVGSLQLNILESATVKNHIRNSFGSSTTSCIEGYNANLETQSQDTMIVIGIIKKSPLKDDCSIRTPMTEMFKKQTLPFSVSGSGDLGKFASVTVKIQNTYYSTSLKAQPTGGSFIIQAVTPIQTTDPDLLLSYKNFYRVEGIVSGRLYNAMVAGDYVDVKGLTFSVVFAEMQQ